MSATAPLLLFDANDMVLSLVDLRDALKNPNNDPTGTYLNSAAVTLENLLDESGTEIAGPSLPEIMVYEVASTGIYRLTLEDGWAFALGELHSARVRADAGAGLRAEWVLPIESQVRTS